MTQTADSRFSEPTVQDLVRDVQKKKIALPDFQRSYVWKPPAVKALLASMVADYPIGSLLALPHSPGNSSIQFLNPIGVEGGPKYDPASASMLLLDGQQRVTTLYHVLTGSGPYHYFVDVDEYVRAVESGDPDQIAASIKHLPSPDYPDNRHVRTKVWKSWTEGPKELREPVIYLGRVLQDQKVDFEDFLEDMDDRELKAKLKPLRKTLIRKLDNFKVPVIWLSKDTAPEALCGVFESINKHGVSLGVFDLKVASLFPKGFNLKEQWRSATEKYATLERFEIERTHVLWAVSLRANGHCSKAHILRKTDESHFTEYWKPVCEGYEKVLGLLESKCGVMGPKFLPYPPALAPMAAAYSTLDKSQRKSQVVLNRLCIWFWCTVFSRRYVEGAQSNAASDFGPLTEWLRGGAVPEVVASFKFDSESLYDAQSNSSALFQAVIALLVSREPESFLSGAKVRFAAPLVDVHHIFPDKWLATQRPQPAKAKVNCVVNKTFITAEDNRTIQDKSPADYLKDIRSKWHTRSKLEQMLNSHFIDESTCAAMEANDFAEFLKQREDAIVRAILVATSI